MKACVGLFLVFLSLASFAHGQVGAGVLFGLIAWGVFASGSGGGGGGKSYRYAGSTHHYERVG